MTFSNNKEQTPENQGIAFSRSTSSQKVVRGTLLAACMIGTALNGTTQGQEYSRVNSAGGPGLNQFSTSISSTADGAAVVWLETKDGKRLIRMRRVDGQGEAVDSEMKLIHDNGGNSLSLISSIQVGESRILVSWSRDKTDEEQATDESHGSKSYLHGLFDTETGRALIRPIKGRMSLIADSQGSIWRSDQLESGILHQLDESLQSTGFRIDAGTLRSGEQNFLWVEKARFVGSSYIRTIHDFNTWWEPRSKAHVFCIDSGREYLYELTDRNKEPALIEIEAINEDEFGILCSWHNSDPANEGVEASLHEFSGGGSVYQGSVSLKLLPAHRQAGSKMESSRLISTSSGWTVCHMTSEEMYCVDADERGVIPGAFRFFDLEEVAGSYWIHGSPYDFARLGDSDEWIVANTATRNGQKDVLTIAFDPSDERSMRELHLVEDFSETDTFNLRSASNSSGEAIVSWVQRSHVPSESGYFTYIQRYDANGRSLGEPERIDFATPSTSYRVTIAQDGSNALYRKFRDTLQIWKCEMGENEGRPVEMQLGDIHSELQFDSITVAMSPNGEFIMAMDDRPSVHPDSLRIQRHDSEGHILEGSTHRIGYTDALSGGTWYVKATWNWDSRSYVVGSRFQFIDGQWNSTDHLFRLDSDGNRIGWGTELENPTAEHIREVQHGADGRILVIRSHSVSTYEPDGTFIRQGTALPVGISGWLVDAAARLNGGWTLSTLNRGWEVDSEGMIEEDSMASIPQMKQDATRFEFACAVIGGAKTIFTIEPYTDNSGLDVVRINMGGGRCGKADFNCDGTLDAQDLSYLLANWGTKGGDLNGDGNTDGADLAEMLTLWSE